MYICMYECVYVCMYVCMYVWMYGCMYVCMFGCVCVFVYLSILANYHYLLGYGAVFFRMLVFILLS